MVVFPNCKINLGLYVTGKLPDGFHNLQTLFYPIPLHDVLEIITLPVDSATTLSVSGIAIEATADNSCLKAYELLKNNFLQLPPVAIHLHKAIPIGGGLGGGSADAAFTLLLLNKKYNLGISEVGLMQYALQLGSDCPFFIKNSPQFATGRGEKMQPVPIDLSAYKIVLVNPGIHVSTGWAFTQVTLKEPETALTELAKRPITEWKQQLDNVFETPIFQKHPSIKEIKDTLYKHGAVYASMSGSGATVFGIFKKEMDLQFSFPPHYLVKVC